MSSYPGPDDEEEDTEVVDLEDTDEVDEEGYVVDVDDEEDKSFEEELHCSVEVGLLGIVVVVESPY